jgi:hypothetical protein
MEFNKEDLPIVKCPVCNKHDTENKKINYPPYELFTHLKTRHSKSDLADLIQEETLEYENSFALR